MGCYDLTYFGVLRSHSSWAKAARELLTALQVLGLRVNIFERRGFLYNEHCRLPDTIEAEISHEFKGPVVCTFEHPRNYHLLPRNTRNIGLLVYEFSMLPQDWVSAIAEHLDFALVPSAFCREIFLRSGVPAEKCRVLRYGYNSAHYFPAAAPHTGPFRLLCVAAPHKREGLELLLDAYSLAFRGDPAIELLIKLQYLPGRSPKPFECSNLLSMLNARSRVSCGAEVLSDFEMGELYRGADAYVSLSRGEAFGLCFLEALACGIPVVAPAAGGQRDFLNEHNSRLISCDQALLRGQGYEDAPAGATLLLPSVEEAAEALQALYTAGRASVNPDQLLAPSAAWWQWPTVAQDFAALLAS